MASTFRRWPSRGSLSHHVERKMLMGPPCLRLSQPGPVVPLRTWKAVASIQRRSQSTSSTEVPVGEIEIRDLREKYKNYFHLPASSLPPRATGLKEGDVVTIHGFISKTRKKSPRWLYFDVTRDEGPRYEFRLEKEELSKVEGVPQEAPDDVSSSLRRTLRSIPRLSPVTATGVVVGVQEPGSDAQNVTRNKVMLRLTDIHCLNEFPKNVIVDDGVQFPPKARHLQLRFHPELQARLRFRSSLTSALREATTRRGFMEIETPILFKSTSEGAREFIVPLRRPGLAYALQQSPQQYKQILMASGFGGYYQLARCFRDEDLRADRQPEFTQLDFEKPFLNGEGMMQEIEGIIRDQWQSTLRSFTRKNMGGAWVPVPSSVSLPSADRSTDAPEVGSMGFPDLAAPFPRLSYQACMDSYGTDKPDLRIPNTIYRFESLSPDFARMITGLNNPIVEAWKVSLSGTPDEVREFVTNFMEQLPNTLKQGLDGSPQILVYNSAQPLSGFSSLGPEGPSAITEIASEESGLRSLDDGDIVVFQARKNVPHDGGSTRLGQVRTALYNAAVSENLLEKDPSFKFLWVTDFPLFTLNNSVDPGQGGTAGFSSTHHPFTAPLTTEDFDLLFTDPLRAKADHYDLVLNGVELGGGSRRIHVADLQEFIFRDILKMPHDKIAEFSHLLRALRDGCPPHAGFALGLDRYCAVLSDTPSVRDVIAFPKSMKGEDLLAHSPGKITDEQLKTYHLQARSRDSELASRT